MAVRVSETGRISLDPITIEASGAGLCILPGVSQDKDQEYTVTKTITALGLNSTPYIVTFNLTLPRRRTRDSSRPCRCVCDSVI